MHESKQYRIMDFQDKSIIKNIFLPYSWLLLFRSVEVDAVRRRAGRGRQQPRENDAHALRLALVSETHTDLRIGEQT